MKKKTRKKLAKHIKKMVEKSFGVHRFNVAPFDGPPYDGSNPFFVEFVMLGQFTPKELKKLRELWQKDSPPLPDLED